MCFAQEHNTMAPAMACTQTAWARDECTNQGWGHCTSHKTQQIMIFFFQKMTATALVMDDNNIYLWLQQGSTLISQLSLY